MIIDQYEYLKGILDPDISVIFDVGAKKGDETAQLLRLFPLAHVWAFDCAPKAVAALKAQYEKHLRVTVVDKAILDEPQSVTLNLATRDGSSSIYPVTDAFAQETQNLSRLTVQATTLDHFTKKNGIDHIDLLKIDVEGADLLVLEGAKRLFKNNCIHAVMVELLFYPYYTGQCWYDEIIYLMVARGFSLYDFYPQYWGGRLRYADALYLKG